MGFWNKKKLTIEERVQEVNSMIRNIIDDYPGNISVVFLIGSGKGGLSLVEGSSEKISSLIKNTSTNDEGFSNIIKSIGIELSDSNEQNIPPHIKSMLDKMNGRTSAMVDLPNGDRAIAIDPNRIQDISDEEVDDIIDEMLKNIKKNSDDSKG